MQAAQLEAQLEDRLVAEFDRDGFCVVPSALSEQELRTMRDAVLDERSRYPEHFRLLGQSRDGGPVGEHGRWHSGVSMYATDAFDALVGHPAVLGLLRRLIGPDIGITGLGSVGIRDTPAEPAPARGEIWPVGGNGAVAPWGAGEGILWQMWHREQGGKFAPHHPRCITSLQCRWQFNDTTPETTCVSAVPESVAEKKALTWAPLLLADGRPHPTQAQLTEPFVDTMWRNRTRDSMHLARPGVDICARAGDVIIINNTNIHAGTVRAGSPMRIDFRLDYAPRGWETQAVIGELPHGPGGEQARAASYGGGGRPIPPRLAAKWPDLIDSAASPPPTIGLAREQPANYLQKHAKQAGGFVTSPAMLGQIPAGACTPQQMEPLQLRSESVSAEQRHAQIIAAVERAQRELGAQHKL